MLPLNENSSIGGKASQKDLLKSVIEQRITYMSSSGVSKTTN
jgi:hypothetical protein